VPGHGKAHHPEADPSDFAHDDTLTGFVIPAQAGIQLNKREMLLDTGFRRYDEQEDMAVESMRPSWPPVRAHDNKRGCPAQGRA